MKTFEEHWCENYVRFDDGRHKHEETYNLGVQSRQVEVDSLNEQINQLRKQINQMAEVGLSQESSLMERFKRIEKALDLISNSWNPDVDQKLFIENLEKILRGEHEHSPTE